MKHLVVGMGKINSQRAPYKLLRPLGKTTVIEHGLSLLKNIEADAHWYYTRDNFIAKIAYSNGLTVINRSQKSTTGNTFFEVWNELASLAIKEKFDIVTWINTCCPFVNIDRIYKLTRVTPDRLILPVIEVEEPYWKFDGTSIADRPELNTQKSNKLLSLNHSWWIRTPDMMIKTENSGVYVEQHRNALLEKINAYEALDIDDELSYQITNSVFTSLISVHC